AASTPSTTARSGARRTRPPSRAHGARTPRSGSPRAWSATRGTWPSRDSTPGPRSSGSGKRGEPRGQLLRRHPALRAELLREDLHPEFLQVPAQGLPGRVVRPPLVLRTRQRVDKRLEFQHALLVAGWI